MSLQNVSLLKWGGCFLSFEISGRGLGSEMGVWLDSSTTGCVVCVF